MQEIYWTDLLVQKPPKEFICPVSLDLLIDPYLTPCGHHFSKEVIENLAKENKPCPVCRDKIITDGRAGECNEFHTNEAQTKIHVAWEKEVPELNIISKSEAMKNKPLEIEVLKYESLKQEPLKTGTLKNEVQENDALTDVSLKVGVATCREPLHSDEAHIISTKETFTPICDEALKRRINALEVRCKLGIKGCTWTGPLSKLQGHLSSTECQYVETECPYSCGKNIRRGLLEEHKANNCSKRPFICPYCNSMKSSYDDINTNHMPTCAARVIDCPENCGEINIALQSLKKHLDHCPNMVTDCEYAYAGCNVKMMRKISTTHNANSIEYHYRLLETYWNTTVNMIRSIQAEDQQMESLSAFNICNNYLEFKVEDYEQCTKSYDSWYSEPFYTHIRGYKLCIKFDASQPTACRLNVQLIKGEFDSELEFPFYGEIVIQLVDESIEEKQQSEINITSACSRFNFNEKQQSEINKTSSHTFFKFDDERKFVTNNRLVFQIISVIIRPPTGSRNALQAQLQDHIKHSPAKVEECNYCYMVQGCSSRVQPNAVCKIIDNILGPLSIQVHEMVNALQKQRKVLDKLYSSTSKPVVYQDLPEFQMKNFQHYYNNHQTFRSKPFYTHFGGYKMHLRVDGYGAGNEEGHHLCVAVVLMKGPFDDRLEFPFRGEITVQLFKRNSQTHCFQSRFIFTSSVPPKVGCKVTDAQHQNCYEVDHGLENKKFIPLEEVKDCDSLIFKIAKVAINIPSISCDSSDQRLALQKLHMQEKGEGTYTCV